MSHTQWVELDIHTVKFGNSTDQVRILYKMKTIISDKIVRTNLNQRVASEF